MIAPYFTELHLQPQFGEKYVAETGHFEQKAEIESQKYITLPVESYWDIFTQSTPKLNAYLQLMVMKETLAIFK